MISVIENANKVVHKFTLENGLKCLIKEDRSAPVAAIQFWVGTGSTQEEQFLGAGLSHYVEHMIFKGTPTRSPTDITRQITGAGGEVNAYTSHDRTVFYTIIPSEKWEVGFDVLADAMMHASFPEEEWEREKEVILREMDMGKDDPDRVSSKQLYRTAYRVHPLRHPVIGYREVFTSMSREDLLSFFHRHYVPDNMMLVIVGDVDANQVKSRINDTLSSFKREARAPVILPDEPEQVAPRFERETGNYNISRFHWAYHTVSLSHEDAPTLDVLSSILGHGRSSRLVRTVKEEKKLVYSIDAWSFTPGEPGLFGISATYKPENEDAVLAAIQEELDKALSEGFTEEEIDKAKRLSLTSELSDLETAAGQARSLASGEFYAGNPGFSASYLHSISEVDNDSLVGVFKKYVKPTRRTLSILSPEGTAAPETIDAEANGIPEVRRTQLDNSIPLIVREDHRLPFVHFSIVLNGGLLAENASNKGISQLAAELLTRGTTTRRGDELAAMVEARGGSLSAFSGHNSFGLTAKCLSDDAELFLQLLADCLLNPTFTTDEIEKQKTIQIGAIKQQEERPMFIAQQQLGEEMFPRHPYQWSSTGTVESMGEIDREEIVALHKKTVVSGNVCVSIFGDISGIDAEAMANRILASVPEGSKPEWEHPVSPIEKPVRAEKRIDKKQAIFLHAFPGMDLHDERVDAANLMKTSLSGLASELGIEIREKRGLVYYVGAYHHVGLDPGQFVFYAGTEEKSIPELERLMNEQIERIAQTGLTDEEFGRAQAQMLRDHYKSLQNNSHLSQSCALNELYGLGFDYTFGLEDRLKSLTPSAVKNTADSIFRNKGTVTSIVLPIEQTPNEGDTP